MSEPASDRVAPSEPPLDSLEQKPQPERIRGRERFRHAARLRSMQDFQRVRRSGRSLGGALLAFGYARRELTLELPQSAPPHAAPYAATRVGFSISKRVGGAVVRNLVKRRLRESIRRRLSRVAGGWDIVITARPAAASATFGELDAELAQLLERARLLPRETGAANSGSGGAAAAAPSPREAPSAESGAGQRLDRGLA